MIRWMLWIVGGLVLGGLFHLGSIMLLPRTAPQDAAPGRYQPPDDILAFLDGL